jgi:hypothetical protein
MTEQRRRGNEQRRPAMTEERRELRKFLDRNGPGKVPQITELARLLAPTWPDLSGSDAEAMESWKLTRMEDPVWRPPVLSFGVERHGAIVAGGSTRAEVQTWMVDLDRSEARLGGSTRRQVRPAAPRLDVAPLVAEVVRAVVAGSDDDCLKWSPDRRLVTITVGRIIPAVGFQQTITGRRRRFRERLLADMRSIGWVEIPGEIHTYEKEPDDGQSR